MSDKIKEIKRLINDQAKHRQKNVKVFISNLRRLLDRYLVDAVDFKGIELEEAASIIGGLQQGLIDAGLPNVVNDLRHAYAEELTTINAALSTTVSKTILSTVDAEVVNALIDFDGEKITRLIAPYIDDVGSTALRYAIAGEKPDIAAILEKSGGLIERQVSTEVETLLMTFNRTVTAKKAEEFKLDLFFYYGPDDKATRPFCQDTLEQKDPPIYSIDEIKGMDNGQGLDVLTSGGGYNCRHHWQPVSKDLAIEMGWKDEEI